MPSGAQTHCNIVFASLNILDFLHPHAFASQSQESYYVADIYAELREQEQHTHLNHCYHNLSLNDIIHGRICVMWGTQTKYESSENEEIIGDYNSVQKKCYEMVLYDIELQGK